MKQEYQPKSIVLEVTPYCNNDCLYCYNVWRAPRSTYPQGRMSKEEIFKIIDSLREDLPLESVAISGGEPFTRPDLSEIVSYLWARNLNTVIISNGTLLTKENIARTAGAHNYEVPLLSYKPNIHNYLTQNDCFDKVIDGMRNLDTAGARFAVAFIATKLNYQDLEKTLDLALAMGAEGFLYNRMNVSINNHRHLEELLPDLDMIRQNLEVLEHYGATYGVPISCSIPVQPCLIDMSQYPHVYSGYCPLAGKNNGEDAYFTVDPLGNLRVCNHSSVILGNLLKDRFRDLVNHPVVQDYRQIIPEACVACPPDIRDYCQGGCKAAAEVCSGFLTECEPFLKCHLSERTIPVPIS